MLDLRDSAWTISGAAAKARTVTRVGDQKILSTSALWRFQVIDSEYSSSTAVARQNMSVCIFSASLIAKQIRDAINTTLSECFSESMDHTGAGGALPKAWKPSGQGLIVFSMETEQPRVPA